MNSLLLWSNKLYSAVNFELKAEGYTGTKRTEIKFTQQLLM